MGAPTFSPRYLGVDKAQEAHSAVPSLSSHHLAPRGGDMHYVRSTLMTSSMNCPFCGTDVPQGFIVCRGCGACYRRDKGRALMSLILFGFFGLVAGAISQSDYVALAVIGVGVLVSLWWDQKRWYRWVP